MIDRLGALGKHQVKRVKLFEKTCPNTIAQTLDISEKFHQMQIVCEAFPSPLRDMVSRLLPEASPAIEDQPAFASNFTQIDQTV
jgi:hypothetical protein